MTKTTIVTLSRGAPCNCCECVNVRNARNTKTITPLYAFQAEDLFGTRIVNAVREAHGKPVRVEVKVRVVK